MAKATYAALIAGCLFLLPGTTRAESLAPVNAPVSFSLAVVGSVPPHATYWVSYGPLNGLFRYPTAAPHWSRAVRRHFGAFSRRSWCLLLPDRSRLRTDALGDSAWRTRDNHQAE